MAFLDHLMSFPWMKPLGWALIHFLWQGTLIGLATMAVLRAGRFAPAARYLIGLAALAICAAAPVANFLTLAKPWEKPAPIVLRNAPVDLSAPTGEETAPPLASKSAEPAASSSLIQPDTSDAETKAPANNSIRWSILPDLVSWFVVLWFAGVFVFALRLAIAWLRVQGWRRHAQPAGVAWVDEAVNRLSEVLGVRFGIPARVSSAIPGALTLGFFKPVILLPAQLLTGLPREQVEAIIAHELAHIRRHDYLVNLLQSVVEVVLFYHPVIWWLSREIRQSREECCDELALVACGNRKAYTTALVALAEMQLTPALGASGGSLLTRIYRLAGKSTRDPLFTARNAAWFLSLLTVALTSWLVLFSSQLVAQDTMEIANTKQAPAGRVLDEKGMPVHNAEVVLYHKKSGRGIGNQVMERTRTDADGRFALSSKLQFETPFGSDDTDHYLMFAVADEKALAWKVIVGGTSEAKSYDFLLTAPITQTFLVVDKVGNPIQGANVRLDIARDIGACSALTDAEGRATVTNLPNSTFYMEAEKEGFEECFPCTTPKQGDPRFTLKPEATLEGMVRDPFGTPVEGAVVWLLPKFNWHHYFVAKTDRDGRYKVRKIWSDGEEADWGSYEVGISHPSFTARTKEVKFGPGETKSGFDISAEPGVKLEGTLVDSSGKLIQGGEVAVDSGSGRQHVFSDLSGRFRCRVVPGKIFAFCLAAPGGHYFVDEQYGRVDTLAFGSVLEMRLSYGVPVGLLGRVYGKVESSQGTPVARCEVKIVPRAGILRSTPFHRGSNTGVVTNTEGIFEASAVPIGLPVVVKAETAKGKQIGMYEEEIRTDGQVLAQAIRLENTDSLRLQICDENEKPLANTGIFIEPLASGLALSVQTIQTDKEGMLSIPNVLRGVKYKLSLARDRSQPSPPPNDAVAELVNAEGKALVSQLVLSDKLAVRLLGTDGEEHPIKEFKQYFVMMADQMRWSNGQMVVLTEKGNDVIVSRKFFALGGAGSKVETLVETKDGNIVETEGYLPAIPSDPLVLRAIKPMGKPDTHRAPAAIVAKAGEIVGRVLDPEGKPVAGALVTEGAGGLPHDPEPWKSGADGVFRIPPDESDYLTYLTISKEGFGPVFLTDFEKGNAFDVKLQNTTRLKGVVAGAAPGKVKIRLDKTKSTKRQEMGFEVSGIQFRAETAADGSYNFPIEPGAYQYALRSADDRYAKGEVTVRENESASLDQELKKGHSVSFELIDCQSGKPVKGLELFIVEELDAYHRGLLPNSQKMSDANGRITWENVMPGSTEFSGTKLFHSDHEQAPYCRWWREDESSSPRKIDYARKRPTKDEGTYSIYADVQEKLPPIRVLLERGVKVSGKVSDSDGKATPNFAIAVVTNDESRGLTGDSRFTMQTQQDGTFAGYIPAGNGIVYNLCAFNPENETSLSNAVSEPFSSTPGDEFTFDLKASPGGWISGKMVDSQGEPLSGVEIQAENQDHRDLEYATKKAVTDEQGKFRVGPLRAGKYEIQTDSERTLSSQPILIQGKEEKDAGDLVHNGAVAPE